MKEQNITVALRVRPINPREVRSGATPIARVVDKNLVVLLDPNRDSDDILRAKRSQDHSYMFDVAFPQRASQREVYQQTAQRLVSKVISGYNATVFAYGPTGAGKTYTMLGKAGEPGIMALTLSDLFSKMEQNKAVSKYRVTMAYVEIYNETVRNLLGPSSTALLDLREDAHGATVVSGLMEVEVHDTDEVMTHLMRGNLRRTCEPTAVNKTSSRSHAILKVTVEQQSQVLNICQKIRTGVLFMIDLAGSERAANTQNRGQRMKEGAHINRSLLALANCINTLTVGAPYVNYRDSKLTRLLKNALSGNCYTVMVAHISPASICYEESKNTLKYADRVKHLKTKVTSNVMEVDQHVSQYQECIETMENRIQELERQLQLRGDSEGDRVCSELRSLLKEEKKIREEMVSLEHRLLLNAVERQKHTATIRFSGAVSTPSPLPPSSLSPLPTTLEDTGQASLLFQKLPHWFSEPGHMTNHLTESLEGTAADQTQPTAAEESTSDHMTAVESSHDDHMTSVDSGLPAAEMRETVMAEEESEEACQARTELAGLQMDRRRLEARHRRLGRKLMEIRTKKSQLQKRVSVSVGLHQNQAELCVALQLCAELEEEGRQRELAGAQASLQLGRRESTLQGLLELNQQLITALTQYKALLEERVSSPPGDRLPPLEPLFSRSSRLTWHAERERRLPVAGRSLQLPTFSAFSARLCTTASTVLAGSKSNLVLEDVTDGEEEEMGACSVTDTSDLPLSTQPTSLPQDSQPLLPLFSSASLPPVPASTSLTSPHITTHIPHELIFPHPSTPAAVPLTSDRHLTTISVHSQATPPPSPPSLSVLPQPTSDGGVVTSTNRTSILSMVSSAQPAPALQSSAATDERIVSPTSPSTEDCRTKQGERESQSLDKGASVGSANIKVVAPSTELPEVTAESAPAAEDATHTASKAESTVADPLRPEPVGQEERELQSHSQLSLAHSTHTRTKAEGRARKRARAKVPSVPAVRISEKAKRETLPIRPVDKSRQVLGAGHRRHRERQTLVPTKVIAGSHINASPYLTTTTTSKFETKGAVFRKANPTKPKFKSPYHISMAKTNKSKK